MKTKAEEQYITFRKKLNFYIIYKVDKEKISMHINKNIAYLQPYSKEWHKYIKETCLQIYPKIENPLRLFYKQYNKSKIQQPKVKAFQAKKLPLDTADETNIQ